MKFINPLVVGAFFTMTGFIIYDSSYFPYFLLTLFSLSIVGYVNYRLFHFKELNFFALKSYAKRWVKKYPAVGINKISLYRYSSKDQQHYRLLKDGERIPTKYALIFEVSRCDEEFEHIKKVANETSNETLKKIGLGGEEEAACENFINATEFYTTLYRNYRAFIDSSFKDVYKEKPDKKFLKDWIFIPIKCGEKLNYNVLKNEPHWTLYQKLFPT